MPSCPGSNRVESSRLGSIGLTPSSSTPHVRLLLSAAKSLSAFAGVLEIDGKLIHFTATAHALRELSLSPVDAGRVSGSLL